MAALCSGSGDITPLSQSCEDYFVTPDPTDIQKDRAARVKERLISCLADVTLRTHDLTELPSDREIEELFDTLKRLTPQTNLDPASPYSIFQSKKFENGFKNRYQDIAPYDHNLIDPSYYFNGSPIELEGGSFFATQSPLETTKGEYYELILREKVNLVITLCMSQEKNPKTDKLEEKGVEWWPFITIKESCIAEAESGEKIILRELSYREHEFKQIHYCGWPDNGIPNHFLMLTLIKLANAYNVSEPKRPTVVHCSAGAGRSGICIAILSLVRQRMPLNQVPFMEVILKLRLCRPLMVQQNWQQLKSIMEIVRLALTSPDDIQAAKKD